MRKIILILFCILCLNNVSAQYFIPLFDPIVDSMGNCHLMINDSTVDYLNFFMSDSSGVSNAYTYRDNQVQLVNQSTYYQNNFEVGTTTQSGKLIVRHHLDQINEIDSLNFQNCFYGFCNMPVNKAIISRNDTIFFNEGFTVRFLAPDGSTSVIGVSTGVSGVNDLEFYNGHLYASGTFTAMDGNSACKYICWWDGVNWNPVNQTGIVWGGNPGIGRMIPLQNKLIVGGGFDSVNGVSSNILALYNGTSWSPIEGYQNGGGGFGCVYHDRMYIVGQVQDYNNNWSGLVSYSADSLVFNYNYPLMAPTMTADVFNDTLFVGGSFNHIGYIPARNVAKFVDNSFSSFAQVTTKWWYNSGDTAYKYYQVARDTFIMHTANYYGYNCRKITGEQHEHDSTVTQLQPLYVFGDTNRVMYYNNYRGRFVPLYNFNVSTGDTITYYTPQPQTASDTTFRVVVDSITLLNIQGTNYKRVWSTPLDSWSFGNDGYVQLVGGMGSMLPQLINYYNSEGPLRCYEDTSVFYHYLVTINCEQLDTSTGVEELFVSSYQLSVSNINDNSIAITVLISRSTQAELLIYNMQGQLVSSKNITLRAGENHFTESTPYAQGMYLLQVRTKNEVRNFKFVRE